MNDMGAYTSSVELVRTSCNLVGDYQHFKGKTSASIFRAQDKMETEVSSKKVLKFRCL
jgi:hypothetical protein